MNPLYKIGFCWVFPEAELVTRLPAMRQMGFDGVEFWDGFLVKTDIDRLADALHASQMQAAQLCPYFNFVDGQELWDQTMRLAEKYIAWSVKLGRPLLRVFTGVPWGDKTIGPDKATPQQWDAAIRGLQRVCDMAASHGVRLALECHTGSLMEDTPSTQRLLEGVSRPNLGVNLQLPLKDGREDVYQSIAALGKYTLHMHSHNYNHLPMDKDTKLTFLGQGVLDYPRILRELIARGFNGYVSIEHPDHIGLQDPWHTAQVEAAYLSQLREQLTAQLRV